MKRGLRRWAAVLRAAIGVLAADMLAAGCAGDGVQVPQSELTGALERKVGLIAFLVGVWVAAASGRLEPRWVADGFVGSWSRQ